MKLIFVLLIFLYQNGNVKCDFIGTMKNIFHDVARFMEATYEAISSKINSFIHPKPKYSDITVPTTYIFVKKPINVDSDELTVMKTVHRPKINFLKKNAVPAVPMEKNTEPTVPMSFAQLIESQGRKAETHILRTQDGFVLAMHRIVSQNVLNAKSNKTVLLHHGLLGSSADWLMLGANGSLPYLLSDAGYDVWMTNARGNRYSHRHVKLQPDSPKYWNFSWQEIGQYDLPAVIDHIRKIKANDEKIDFIGHSMGVTALLVLLSTSQEYNQYIRVGVLLAPLVYMKDVKGPLSVFSSENYTAPEWVLNSFIGKESTLKVVPKDIQRKMCNGSETFCSNPLFFFAGSMSESPLLSDAGYLARIKNYTSTGGSLKTLYHYCQLIKSGKFHAFNEVDNEFLLGNVTVPLALFSSDADWLASHPGVTKLYVSIANPIEHIHFIDKNITHTDFVWGYMANSLVFTKVLKILKTYEPKNLTTINEV